MQIDPVIVCAPYIEIILNRFGAFGLEQQCFFDRDIPGACLPTPGDDGWTIGRDLRAEDHDLWKSIACNVYGGRINSDTDASHHDFRRIHDQERLYISHRVGGAGCKPAGGGRVAGVPDIPPRRIQVPADNLGLPTRIQCASDSIRGARAKTTIHGLVFGRGQDGAGCGGERWACGVA